MDNTILSGLVMAAIGVIAGYCVRLAQDWRRQDRAERAAEPKYKTWEEMHAAPVLELVVDLPAEVPAVAELQAEGPFGGLALLGRMFAAAKAMAERLHPSTAEVAVEVETETTSEVEAEPAYTGTPPLDAWIVPPGAKLLPIVAPWKPEPYFTNPITGQVQRNWAWHSGLYPVVAPLPASDAVPVEERTAVAA